MDLDKKRQKIDRTGKATLDLNAQFVSKKKVMSTVTLSRC